MAPSREERAELMSAYLDAELEPEQAQAFEAYLASSPEAQAELEELRKMLTLVGTLSKAAAPEDFYEKLSRRLRRRTLLAPENSWLTSVALPFQVLSIVVILVVAGLYMMAQLETRPGELSRETPPPLPETSHGEAGASP